MFKNIQHQEVACALIKLVSIQPQQVELQPLKEHRDRLQAEKSQCESLLEASRNWPVPADVLGGLQYVLRGNIKKLSADIESCSLDEPTYVLRHDARNPRARLSGAAIPALRVKSTIGDLLAMGSELAPETIKVNLFKGLDTTPDTMKTIRAVYSSESDPAVCRLAQSLARILKDREGAEHLAQAVLEEIMSIMDISRSVSGNGTDKKAFITCEVRGKDWYPFFKAAKDTDVTLNVGHFQNRVRKTLRGCLFKHISDIIKG